MIEVYVMTETPSLAVSTNTLSAVSQAASVQRSEVVTFQDQISVRTEVARVEVVG